MFSRFRRTAPAAPATGGRGGFPLISLLITGVVGVLVLTDVLVRHPVIDGIGALLLDYAVIIAAFALLLGLLHLLRVHFGRVTRRGAGWQYSLMLLGVTLFFTAAGLLEGANGAITLWGVQTLLLPLQAAFFSLLAFFLISVLYRTARARSFEGILMALTALLVVIAGTPVGTALLPLLGTTREWLMATAATGGARALLLGIAVGTIITAFRFITDGRRFFK